MTDINTNHVEIPRIAPSDERMEFLSRIASMYYEQNMTQQAISDMLGYSRSAISRFLTEARDVGIVEIRVRHPLERNTLLERHLKETFALKDARVLVRNALTYGQMLGRVGALAARLLEEAVQNGHVVGVSWGTAVYEIANALRPTHRPDVQVLQMIGSLGTTDPQIDGPELARWFAHWCGGRYQVLPTPLIVDSPEIRNALVNDTHVRAALKRLEDVEVAVVGIGSTKPQYSSLARAGYLNAEEVQAISDRGAVGDVCAIHFNNRGDILDIPIGRRRIGASPDLLQRIPTVIGVAAGDAKAPAIHGALLSGMINVLICDDITVQRVLDIENAVGPLSNRSNQYS